jgi:hypothetical protein
MNTPTSPEIDPRVRESRRALVRYTVVDVVACLWFPIAAGWLAARRMPFLAAVNLTFAFWSGSELLADLRKLRRRPL